MRCRAGPLAPRDCSMTSPFRFGYRLNRIMDLLNARANQKLRPHGLGIPGARVLLWLLAEDNRRAGDLAAACSIDPSALSHILRRLAANNLIRRKRQSNDNRSVVVALTPAGRCLAESLAPDFRTLDGVLVQDFSPAERDLMEVLLDRMYRNVLAFEAQQATGKPPRPARAAPAAGKRRG